jgi:putative transposase
VALKAAGASRASERWVSSARRECMDWMLIVGHWHLARVLDQYLAHYNTERPHQSRGLGPPEAGKPPMGSGRVVSH